MEHMQGLPEVFAVDLAIYPENPEQYELRYFRLKYNSGTQRTFGTKRNDYPDFIWRTLCGQ